MTARAAGATGNFTVSGGTNGTDNRITVTGLATGFVDKGLFRARIALPASAPVGRYRVDVLLFQNGQPITRRSRELVVEKVGLERVISSFARQSPWAYGMVCMLIALAAGWAASAVFRRV
jgi:uncharacterized protein (TIGR02186 family)